MKHDGDGTSFLLLNLLFDPTKTESSPPPCGRDEFRCRRSQRCIPVSSLCDGRPDCGQNDDSDENLGCREFLSHFSLLVLRRHYHGSFVAVTVSKVLLLPRL